MTFNRPPHLGLAAALAIAGTAIMGFAGRILAGDDKEPDVGVWPAQAVYRGATAAEDLTFPVSAEPADRLTSPRMALLKPDGTGPFPAIVLMHQCAGPSTAVVSWARKAVARGYVVLLVDSLGPRGVASVCYGPRQGVTFFRGARDALQAAEHLRRQPFVDRDRIALVGFSWGAMVGLLASSPHYAEAVKAGPTFAAVVSFYPGCFRITPKDRPPFELVNGDIARPVLVLMGAADTETPAAECLRKLAPIREAGAPIEWHVYPDTTHCWDCELLDGRSKIDMRGHHVEYRFRRDITADAERRLFAFLERTMPQKR